MSRYRLFMNKLSILPIALVGLGTMTLPAPVQAVIGFDQNVTPDVIFGSGNANGSFTTDRSNSIELGLRGKLRHNAVGLPENTFNSNGDGTYSFQAIVGPTQPSPTAEWSFEWTVNSDMVDTVTTVLGDLTYELGIDSDPGLGTSFIVFDPINVACADHSTGNNGTNDATDTVRDCADPVDAVLYPGDLVVNNVAQNSWKPHWFIPGFDPTVAGTYAIYLQAKDGGGVVVARTEIQILTGGAPAAVQPLVDPVSYDMINGGKGTYDYVDESYTGGSGDPTAYYSVLADGLGDLTDGFIPTDHWNSVPNVSNLPYVGWRIPTDSSGGSNTDPSITFNFASSTAFESVTIFVDGSTTGGVGVPDGVDITVGSNATRSFPTPDAPGTAPTSYSFPVGGDVGDTVVVNVYHRVNWIMLSEVIFSGDILPIAIDDLDAFIEDDPATTIDVLGNDDNADGGPMSIDSVTQPTNGTVAITNGGADLTYMPAANYCNDSAPTDDFTYTVMPGGSTAYVSVRVLCVNDAPVAVANNYGILEDDPTPLTGNVITDNTGEGVDYDVDGDALMFAGTSSTMNGIIVFDGDELGGFSYVPHHDFCGADSFTYFITEVFPSITPPSESSNTVTVDITVTCVNDAPIAENNDYTTDEDTQLVGNIITDDDTTYGKDSDADGDSMSIVANTMPAHGALVLNPDGSFTYDPTENYCGTDEFLYTITDDVSITPPSLNSNEGTVSIMVTCVNDAPVANDDPTSGSDYAATEDTLLTINVATGVLSNDTDADGDVLSVKTGSVLGPSSGILNLAPNGSFTYDPFDNFCGADSFTYIATDDAPITDPALDSYRVTASIDVACVNDAPVAENNDYTHNEDNQLAENVITDDDTTYGEDSDADGDTLSIYSNTDVDHGMLVLNTDGSFTYDPNENYCGPDDFTYVVTDDEPATGAGTELTSNIATVNITVTCVNDQPTVTFVTPAMQTSDYSDHIGTVTIEVDDVDDTATTLAASNEPPLSVAGGMALSSASCVPYVPDSESPEENGSTCTWTYTGQVLDPGDNIWAILFTPSDAAVSTDTGTHTLTVEPEDATVLLDEGNQTAEEVDAPDGDKTNVVLHYTAWEMNIIPNGSADDDNKNGGSATYGNLNLAEVYMDLVPVGPGGKIQGNCVKLNEPGDGIPLPVYPDDMYAQILYVECTFPLVPVNVYEVDAYVDGDNGVTDRYYAGAAEGLYSVYDPSLGFTTGGGWFYWPDTCSKDYTEVVDGVANGGFESPYICEDGFLTYAAGSNLLTDWDIGGVSIDHICRHWAPSEGDQSLDMSGNGAGSITQALTGLVPGQSYKVSFMLAGNPDDTSPTNAVKTIEVDVGDSNDTIDFNVMTDCGGTCTGSDMGWTEIALMFTATAATMDLSFNSQTDNAWGPALDDVRLFSQNAECNGKYLGDKTNFGFNMKYNKKQTNLQGSLLVMRHTITGETYKVKSNSLDKTLAIGASEDEHSLYDWAAFSGKSTFRAPGVDNTGNNPFLVYVEDHGDQGCNQDPADEFWIEVRNGSTGDVVFEVNGPLSDPAGSDGYDGDDEPIECGNIYVPHQGKGGGGGGNPNK